MLSGSLGQLYVEIGTNLAALHTGLREASGKLDTWASQTQKRLKPFEDSAMAMGAAFGAIAVGVGLAVKSFGDFQAKLNGVASVSSATAAEMEQVRAAAMKMGADTQFSAAEAANGFYELGKAGFAVKEQLDTMPGVVNLAAAAQIGIGEAAETTAGLLRGFGLEASKATMVADQLAKAANASAVDVSDLAEAHKYIAPIAQASGQSLEEMNGILAVLGNNMIKGSQAGTSIRSMLVSLQKPSDESAAILAKLGISIQDTQGRMLPMTDIVDQLRTSMKGYTETQKSAALAQVFGQESLSAVMALMNQAPGSVERMVQSMKDAEGSAKSMADGLNKGVNFQLNQLGGSLETVAIKFGQDLGPAVESFLGLLTNLVNAFGNIPGPIRVVILVLSGLVAGFAAFAATLGAISSFVIPQVVAGLKAMGITLNVTAAGVRAFVAAWGPWALVASGVVAAIVLIQGKLRGLHDDLDSVLDKNNQLAASTGKIAGSGLAAWSKFSKGIKLTKEEAKDAIRYLRMLQSDAASKGDTAMAMKRKGQADSLQAMLNAGDVASSGPTRGAAVVDPNAKKKAEQAAKAAATAASKAQGEKEDAAKARLDQALAKNEQFKGGKAGELKALRAYRVELVKIGADKGKIAQLDLEIARTITEQGKAQKKLGLDEAEDQLKKNLTLNERFKGGIAGQVRAYETYLDQLKQAGADQGKIADVERQILELKQKQVDKQQELINKGKEAALGLFNLASGGMQAADQGGVGATPGFLMQNAGTIAQLPSMLQQIAQGFQAALPGLQAALPALAPMFQALSGALAPIAASAAAAVPIVAAFVAALAVLMLAWQQNAGGIQQAVGNLMGALSFLWEAIVAVLQPTIDQVGWIASLLANTLAVVVGIIGAVINVFTRVRDAIWNFVMSFGPIKWLVDGIAWVFERLWDAIAWFVEMITGGKHKLERAGAKQHIGESSAQKREDALKVEIPKLDKLPSAIGQAVGAAVGQVMGSFTSFNPLPVEDMSRANALFSHGPSGRWFVQQETRSRVELVLTGDLDPEKLIAAAQNPQVRSALADAVGRENATVSLVPRFA